MSFSKNYYIFSHELSWRSRYGEWVYITQNALQHGDSSVVNFWSETKNSAVELGNPVKIAYLILLTLHFC